MAAPSEILLNKFKGTLLGALVGDCLGAPFEGDGRVALTVLNNYITKLEDPKTRVPYKAYTDDNAMTRCVAQSLIDKRAFDETDMAKKYVKEYYLAPNRGYGANIVDVFAALMATKFRDVWAPSALQFGGSGSYGNGGAMRVAPVALFTIHQPESVAADTARDSALLTHANPLGYNGAILQCLAVRRALLTPPKSLDPSQFVDHLIAALKALHNPREEDQDVCREFEGGGGYVNKLLILKGMLTQNDPVSSKDVVKKLGNDISARNSVPTAIYAFLRSLQPIQGIQSDNEFLRTVMYSISLGGDTDTIASMAAAIAGAYHGSAEVPNFLSRHCEGWEDALAQAEALHNLVQPTPPHGRG